jgi:hypothetical protein
MTPVWILVGCVAVIGLALVLYKRAVARSAKAEETVAHSAKQ